MTPRQAYLNILRDPQYARLFLKTRGYLSVRICVDSLTDQDAIRLAEKGYAETEVANAQIHFECSKCGAKFVFDDIGRFICGWCGRENVVERSHLQ